MGTCMSSGSIQATERDRALPRAAEEELREVVSEMLKPIKVLLLGSGSSGKSTILKQIRLSSNTPFSVYEIESYRQLVFDNITLGLKCLLDSMEDMDLKVEKRSRPLVDLLERVPRDIKDGEPFPAYLLGPLQDLWKDPNVQMAWERGNEAENLVYFFSDLDRLFSPAYTPTDQDIIHCRARTVGITETALQFHDYEMLVVDVGGAKSERRKWIHCFQDVTCILFLVSLSGYNECLIEDRDANRMQDAMTVWGSICHSAWFMNIPIILFLNKRDLFERKILHSNIEDYFPDFDGERGDAEAGRAYFTRRFRHLAQVPERPKDIYIHATNATDPSTLSFFKADLEDAIRRSHLQTGIIH